MCSLLFPFRRLVLFAQKGAPRSPAERASGAAALELLAAGRLLCERRGGIIATSFTIFIPKCGKMDGRREARLPAAVISVPGCYFSSDSVR